MSTREQLASVIGATMNRYSLKTTAADITMWLDDLSDIDPALAIAAFKAHRIDPDTGGQGRDGRIAEVRYDPRTDQATVALDSRRDSVDALLERLAVVVGTG